MLAKRFFFASAGILCLTLAYHLGSATATAQGPAGVRPLGESWFLSAGTVYRAENCDPIGWVEELDLPPVMPASLVAYDGAIALTETGEGWVRCLEQGPWRSIGIIPGATGAKSATWGQLKASYRPAAPRSTRWAVPKRAR